MNAYFGLWLSLVFSPKTANAAKDPQANRVDTDTRVAGIAAHLSFLKRKLQSSASFSPKSMLCKITISHFRLFQQEMLDILLLSVVEKEELHLFNILCEKCFATPVC